jgi:hypothetical protein
MVADGAEAQEAALALGRLPVVEEDEVLLDREVADGAVAHALLGGVGQAGLARRLGLPEIHGAASSSLPVSCPKAVQRA